MTKGFKLVTSEYRPPIRGGDITLDEAWFAGFFEGDGHVRKVKHPRQTKLILWLAITQVNREPLERCEELFGGFIVSRSKRHPNWQPTHEWRIQGQAASDLAKRIYPLLSSRRQEQVRPLIEWVNGKTLSNQRDPDTGRFVKGRRS